jgi:hypothetical protein
MVKKRKLHIPKVTRDQQELVADQLEELKGSRSQRTWAKELGIPQQNVSRYLNGTAPHLSFLIHVARREGVSLNWLVLGEGRKFRPTKRLGG